MKSFLALLSALVLVACGGDDGHPAADAGPGAADATPDPVDADNTGFTTLIGRNWTLPGGTADTYLCVRLTVQADTYVHAFRAAAPNGTHHTVLGITRNERPDGSYACDTLDLGHHMIFASGIGSDDLTFPDGVAVKVKKGQQLVLNLHLFNATEGMLTGPSSILIKTLPAAEVKQQAEAVFAGTGSISIMGSRTDDQYADGDCTADHDFTLFALWPHMHKYGVHQLVTLKPSSGTAKVLLDRDYTFYEQKTYLQQPPTAVHSGDRISVRCVYKKTTPGDVGFGEGSNDEMCFTGLYRYPATDGSVFECAGGLPVP